MADSESTILIVDDDADDLKSVERSLASLGSEFVSVRDPHDVLPAVRKHKPDVVILDALLPGLSGFDLCKQIKTDGELKGTQVIILTGVYLRQQYRSEALQQFKADGFMTKPFRAPELQRLVVQLLAKKTRKPQASFLRKLGLPSRKPRPGKKGLFGRLFARERELPEGSIAPVVRTSLNDESEAEPEIPAPPEVSTKDEEVKPEAKAEAKEEDEAEVEEKAEAEAEEKAEAEAEEKAQAEAEEKAKAEAEDKAQAEAEEKAQAEAEEKAQAEAEEKAQAEAEKKAQAEAENKAKAEAENKAKAEAENKAQAEAEEKAQAEAENKAKAEAENKAQAEAEKKAQAEAEKKAQAEAEEKAQAEAEKKAEAEAKEKANAEKKAGVEKKARAQKKAKAREKAETARKADAETQPAVSAAVRELDGAPKDDAVKWDVAASATMEAVSPVESANEPTSSPSPAPETEAGSVLEPTAEAGPEDEVRSLAETREPSGPVVVPPAPEGAASVRRPIRRLGEVPIYEEDDFEAELRREISKCKRVDRPLTLILIRIGDLEQIVELFGKGFRDPVLWHVAEQAMASLREVDLVGMITSKGLVAMTAFASDRYGGGRIVSRMRRDIGKHPFRVGEELPSIVPHLEFGMASYPQDADGERDLMSKAEADISAGEGS